MSKGNTTRKTKVRDRAAGSVSYKPRYSAAEIRQMISDEQESRKNISGSSLKLYKHKIKESEKREKELIRMLNEAGEAITEASRESSVTESSVAQTTVISESRQVSESGNPGWQASTLADLEEYGSEQESQEPSMVSE